MNKPITLKTIKYKNNTFTIDERLKEFRNITYNKLPIFYSFNSTEGKKILKLLRKE